MLTLRKILFVSGLIAGSLLLSSCSKNDNKYVIETEVGDIIFETYPEKAPITIANFEKYVDQNIFDGASFYRVVRMDNQPNDSIKIEVIQGDFTGKDYYFPTIAHETTDVTGLKHLDGTVSMGRFKVGTTAAEFFICIGDQPELDFSGKRNPDGQGFAAFGQVIDGMDVVKKIQNGETDYQTLKNKIRIIQIKKVKK